ncbi:hypothetical protein PG991_009352 [Apiospora marii]|uniref:Uncharacterized protein n=1 Tax=Apiospora marii TaxID=335849 RepID=A0ABR1RMJ8_9PEZI
MKPGSECGLAGRKRGVKLAIAKEALFMDVVEQMNRTTSGTDVEQEQVGSEARLVMALTQVFSYMMKDNKGQVTKVV